MATRNLKARRKLADLYRRGEELRFGPDGLIEGTRDSKGARVYEGPPGEDEVALWVGPPSPLQREQALRDAQASRAKSMLRLRQDRESEEYLTGMAFLAQMTNETLIDYLLQHDSEDRRSEANRDVLRTEEWEDIKALQEALRPYDEGELEPDVDDPDYRALMDADRRYGEQVDARMTELTTAARESLSMLSRESLERRGLEKRSDLIASQAFMAEYERQMMFYAVRDPEDHGVLFFESAREYAEQDDRVQAAIATSLQQFVSEVAEAKNLQGVVSGSPLSALPARETSEPSTPPDAIE